MTISLMLKAAMIWFVIAIFAILNGIFRESILLPTIGQPYALPVSGLCLSTIIFIITYISFPFFAKNNYLSYLLMGVQWVLMTLIFELLFGHYIFGKSWSTLLQVFNIMQGDLFILALLASLVSPLVVAKIKGALN